MDDDRRCRRHGQARAPVRADHEGNGLCLLQAVSGTFRDARIAHRACAADAGRAAARRAARHRSGAAGVRHPHHDRAHRDLARRPPYADAAADAVRGRGAGPVGGRHLRRAGVRGGAAHRRDRRAPVARRQARRYSEIGAARRRPADRARPGRRPGGCDCDRAGDPHAAVRRRRIRSAHAAHGVDLDRGDCADRVLAAGASRVDPLVALRYE